MLALAGSALVFRLLCARLSRAGFDKEGRPIYIEKSGAITPEVILACCTDDELYWAHILGQEFQVRRTEEQTKKLGKVVETFTTIMDLKGERARPISAPASG